MTGTCTAEMTDINLRLADSWTNLKIPYGPLDLGGGCATLTAEVVRNM